MLQEWVCANLCESPESHHCLCSIPLPARLEFNEFGLTFIFFSVNTIELFDPNFNSASATSNLLLIYVMIM